MSLRSQAATGGQLELPAVHGAGEDAVLDFGEAGQVGFQVGAAPLDTVAVAFPQLLHGGLLGVVALGILQAFGREAFEEVIDVFVISSLTLGLEAAGEKYLVDPVLFMMDDTVLEQGAVDVKAVIPLFILPGVDAARMEIKHDLLHVAVDQYPPVDAYRRQVCYLHEWLEPVAQRSQDVYLPPRPRCLLRVHDGLLARSICFQVGALIAEDRMYLCIR